MKRICLLTLAFLSLLCAPVWAQAPNGAMSPQGNPQSNPQYNPQNNGGAPMRDGMGFHSRESGREHGFEHGGMMGLPPGAWWKNPDIVAKLSLTADQQAKMDDILRQNRLQLVDMKASLEKEQINLEPLLNANPLDTNKTLGEIGKIADLRAGLEKANAKMLLGLRSVLTADQWTKLHTRPERGAGGQGQPGGQPGGGPRGPRAPGGDGFDDLF